MFNPVVNKNNRYILAEIRVEKIIKGLCFFCDQAYKKGHRCKFKEPQLFTIELPGGEGESDCEIDEGENEAEVIEPCISVNALVGNQSFQTMRLKGMVKRKPLHILVDSGSTHNFLDLAMEEQLCCKLEKISAQSITVILFVITFVKILSDL